MRIPAKIGELRKVLVGGMDDHRSVQWQHLWEYSFDEGVRLHRLPGDPGVHGLPSKARAAPHGNGQARIFQSD